MNCLVSQEMLSSMLYYAMWQSQCPIEQDENAIKKK